MVCTCITTSMIKLFAHDYIPGCARYHCTDLCFSLTVPAALQPFIAGNSQKTRLLINAMVRVACVCPCGYTATNAHAFEEHSKTHVGALLSVNTFLTTSATPVQSSSSVLSWNAWNGAHPDDVTDAALYVPLASATPTEAHAAPSPHHDTPPWMDTDGARSDAASSVSHTEHTITPLTSPSVSAQPVTPTQYQQTDSATATVNTSIASSPPAMSTSAMTTTVDGTPGGSLNHHCSSTHEEPWSEPSSHGVVIVPEEPYEARVYDPARPSFDEVFGEEVSIPSCTDDGYTSNGQVPQSCECELCGWKTNSLSAMVAHKRIHTLTQPALPTVREGNSLPASDVPPSVNIYQHNGKKMHECSVCGWQTDAAGVIIAHMRVHTNNRPYVCGQCGYGARKKSDIVRHALLHNGSKPFVCTKCDYKTSRKDALLRHCRGHTGDMPASSAQ